MPWIVIATLLVSCAEPAHPIRRAADTGDKTDCPTGMVAAATSDLFVDYMVLNWVNLYPVYDESKTYSGDPATCIQTNGMGIQQIFEINGQAYGSVTISSNATGNIDLNNFTGKLSVDLYGAYDPVVFDSTDMDSGSLYIDLSENSFEAEASIEAFKDSQQLSMHLFAAATSEL
jgi:hypothetical protein